MPAQRACTGPGSTPKAFPKSASTPISQSWTAGSRRWGKCPTEAGPGEAAMKFHHRVVPIVLVAILIDSIGFGIVMPVLPGLIVHLGHVGLPQATRIAGYMLVAYALAQFFAGP